MWNSPSIISVHHERARQPGRVQEPRVEYPASNPQKLLCREEEKKLLQRTKVPRTSLPGLPLLFVVENKKAPFHSLVEEKTPQSLNKYGVLLRTPSSPYTSLCTLHNVQVGKDKVW